MAIVWTPITLAASKVAYPAHLNQVKKLGAPDIFHLMAVAERCPDDVTGAMGLLHDLAEDTPTWRNFGHDAFVHRLTEAVPGLPAEAAEGLWLLKRPKEMSYKDYIQRLCDSGNRLALIVKKADLESNMDPNRLVLLDTNTAERLRKKYDAVYQQVTQALI